MASLKNIPSHRVLEFFSFAFWIIVALVIIQQPFTARSFMFTDFIQYWSANQCYSFVGDPYSFDCMKQVQAMVGHTGSTPVMMWTPPLSLFIGGFLPQNFFLAGAFFLLFNLLLLGWTSVMIYQMLDLSRPKKILMLFAIYSFYPIWSCLEHGQLGIIFLFSLVFMLYADKLDRKFLMGLAVVPLTLKPHLFIFPMLYLFWRELRLKRYFVLLSSVAAVAAFWALAEFVFPGSLYSWVNAVSRNPNAEAAVSIFEWIPATIPGLLRSFAASSNLAIANSLSMILPLASGALFFWYLVRYGEVKPLKDVFPVLLLFSYLFAPYGWIFDQSILFISFLPIVFGMPARSAYLLLFVLNGGMHFLVKFGIFSSHEQLIVFAIVIALLAWLSPKLWKSVDNSL